MGTASLACISTDSGFERLVVAKRLNERTADDPVALQRLMKEAELAGLVHHANVVPVQYVGQDDLGAYIVLDYVEGASLSQMIHAAQPNPMPRGIVLRLFLDVLAGLDAIHLARDHLGEPLKILHRDATPENILIGLDGMARMTDLGIAKSLGSANHTTPMTVVGKHGYMAPEYLLGQAVGPAMDVYSVGVALWTCLVGRSPWKGLEPPQVLTKTVNEGVPELLDACHVSLELAAVVRRACCLDPEKRFASASEFARRLEEVCQFELSPRHEVVDYVKAGFLERVEQIRARAADEIRSDRASHTRLRTLDLTDSSPLMSPAESQARFRLLEQPTPSQGESPPAVLNSTETTRVVGKRRRAQRKWLFAAGGAGLFLGLVALASLGGLALPTASAQLQQAGYVQEPLSPEQLNVGVTVPQSVPDSLALVDEKPAAFDQNEQEAALPAGVKQSSVPSPVVQRKRSTVEPRALARAPVPTPLPKKVDAPVTVVASTSAPSTPVKLPAQPGTVGQEGTQVAQKSEIVRRNPYRSAPAQ